jgi:octaprenyl-diphosphate synthase
MLYSYHYEKQPKLTLSALNQMVLHSESPSNTLASIDFDSIKNLTANETKAVDQLIINELSSDVILINQMGHYIVGNGGKRLRPMLLLVSSQSTGGSKRQPPDTCSCH